MSLSSTTLMDGPTMATVVWNAAGNGAVAAWALTMFTDCLVHHHHTSLGRYLAVAFFIETWVGIIKVIYWEHKQFGLTEAMMHGTYTTFTFLSFIYRLIVMHIHFKRFVCFTKVKYNRTLVFTMSAIYGIINLGSSMGYTFFQWAGKDWYTYLGLLKNVPWLPIAVQSENVLRLGFILHCEIYILLKCKEMYLTRGYTDETSRLQKYRTFKAYSTIPAVFIILIVLIVGTQVNIGFMWVPVVNFVETYTGNLCFDFVAFDLARLKMKVTTRGTSAQTGQKPSKTVTGAVSMQSA
ncbi:hypothetical protein BKA69DRAFT_1127953 [Paraphysoderma sedebokerense]|nr:hypothetical protein BKA69DRAFT_1127942 [Paraphysoderma sedebokerense]KAI9137772.1 hypothetical protein BKA69DRAFT_1127953 [Paraphysoderma sedebokerense]